MSEVRVRDNKYSSEGKEWCAGGKERDPKKGHFYFSSFFERGR